MQTRDGRQKRQGVNFPSVQRDPKIKEDAHPLTGKFYAGAADLLRSPMDAHAERIARVVLLSADHRSSSAKKAFFQPTAN
jgi:hypothetical protein